MTMGMGKELTRQCPECKKDINYSCKKGRDSAERAGSLCRNCSNKHKKNAKPKEEFTCCICGKLFLQWRSQLSNPETPYCSKQCWYSSEAKSLVGKRFGKLTVLERSREYSTTFYICICDCGKEIKVRHTNLYEGTTSSCGCLVREKRGSERKPLEEVITNNIWNSYKKNAKDRNYEWQLSSEDFYKLINGPCHYCGKYKVNTYNYSYKYETKSLNYNGIDRLNNDIGYIKTNCVSCCRVCNQAKNTLGEDEFKAWIINVFNHFCNS